MPLLFALGPTQVLVEAHARLSRNERLLAFLDDIYIASMPDKVSEAHTIVEEDLRPTHTSTSITAKPKCGIVMVWSLRALRN